MGKKREVDDRFKKFGTVSFTATTKVNDFVSQLEDGKVMAETLHGAHGFGISTLMPTPKRSIGTCSRNHHPTKFPLVKKH